MKLALPALLKRHPRASMAVALVVLLALGYLVLGGGSGTGATYAVVRGDTPQEVAVSGTVKAQSSANLGFAASGRISATYASVGERVAAGTVLAAVENGDERAAVAKAQANLDALTAGTRPEELASAKAAVEGDQAALENALQSAYVSADDAVRNHADALFANPLSSPTFKFPNDGTLKDTIEKERASLSLVLSEWQDALGGVTPATAASAAETAQKDLGKVEVFLDNINRALSEALTEEQSAAAAYDASIATARTNISDASAALTKDQNALASDMKTLVLKQAGARSEDIAAGKADLQNAQAALAKTLVVAPFSGVVTKMDAKAGEIVSPGASEIAMQSDSAYEIEVYIPEVAIAGVAVGNAATTTLDAYGDTPFTARVIAVDPAETVKDGVPTYKTTLEFSHNDPRIRSGMTANVVVVTGVLKDALVIPSGAVGHDAAGAYVSLKSGKKTVHQAVTTGLTPALGKVEITAGLSGGETILLTPQ